MLLLNCPTLRPLEHDRSYGHFIEFPSSLVGIRLLFSTPEVFGHFNQPALILSIRNSISPFFCKIDPK